MPYTINQVDDSDPDLGLINLEGPQPRCEGPKFHPFPNRRATINVIKRLDDPAIQGEAHVFEVSIARKPYALKVVSGLLLRQATLLGAN